MGSIERSITGPINEFISEYPSLETSDSETQFEYFSAYICSSNFSEETLDLEDIVSAGNNDAKIDAAGVFINQSLMNDTSDIEQYTEESKSKNTCEIMLLQATTRKSLDNSKIIAFLSNIRNLCDEKLDIPLNPKITNLIKMLTHIFNNPAKFKGGVNLNIIYCQSNKFDTQDPHLLNAKNSYMEQIDNLDLFKNISINILDSSDLIKKYRALLSSNEAELKFSSVTTLNDISAPERLENMFFGFCKFKDLKPLLINEEGVIKGVFERNVRSYAGTSNVNKSICDTLTSNNANLFAVLNNGITIVADEANSSGNKYALTNYQIVNGCQTSHVLIDVSREHNIDEVDIPIRLIITKDEELKSDITAKTNNQNPVPEIQLFALSSFQHELEEHYGSSEWQDCEKLYYERRKHQYRGKKIPRSSIIDITTQLKSFISIIYQDPSTVTSYLSTPLKTYAKGDNPKIFNQKHDKELYYLCGMLFHKYQIFMKDFKEKEYGQLKFFILMIFSIITSQTTRSLAIESKKEVESFITKHKAILEDSQQTEATFQKAIQLIKESGLSFEKREYKTTDFSHKLLQFLKQSYK